MPTRDQIHETLIELFDAERAVRELHDDLAELPPDELLDVLAEALPGAIAETDEDEASLQLVRIAALLAEIEGPRAVDGLIDVLTSELPEPRRAAGEHLEEIAFERFKEVAQGIERALKRLPVGSPALPELPYVIAEVPEPGVSRLLGKFLSHADPDAVAAAIESLVELGDPGTVRLLTPLLSDKRTVELADEIGDATSEVTIGELALEAVSLLESMSGDEEGDEQAGDGGAKS